MYTATVIISMVLKNDESKKKRKKETTNIVKTNVMTATQQILFAY